MEGPLLPQGSASEVAFATIAHHSKSFALASRVLPPECRVDAAVVYTWCRRADDAVDEADSPEGALLALDRQREALVCIYSEATPADPIMAAFQEVVRRHRIPELYPRELLAGMEMDLRGHRYRTLEDLLLYCYRVAGTVGLMMSHVMGVSHQAALTPAAHLGIAMQLTNICRDVAEDWERSRLYLPAELLARSGVNGLEPARGAALPVSARAGLAQACEALVTLSQRYYRSADSALYALPWRCALAVRTARRVYAAIGDELAERRFDVLAGRAYVSTSRKLLLLAHSLWNSVLEWPGRAFRPFRAQPLTARVEAHELALL